MLREMVRARMPSGELVKIIKNYKSCKPLDIDRTVTDSKSILSWRLIYKKYISKMYKYSILNYVLPKYILNKIVKCPNLMDIVVSGGFEELVENKYVIIDDIYVPQIGSTRNFSNIILDTFTQYILGLDVKRENTICNVLPEGPYELGNVSLSKGDIVIDAGANTGDFSFLASKKSCNVYAFEPSKMIIEKYLKKGITMNKGLAGQITIAPFGLSNERKGASFQVDIENLTSGTIIDSNNDTTSKEKIELISLDEYVNENKIEKIDFIKADIEGAERYMLLGAQNVLKKFSPKLAICTYHLPDDPEVLEALVTQANPEYKVVHKYKKMYAYVPNEN